MAPNGQNRLCEEEKKYICYKWNQLKTELKIENNIEKFIQGFLLDKFFFRKFLNLPFRSFQSNPTGITNVDNGAYVYVDK